MTAEIAILNKSAVALAADSAITVNIGNREKKIFPSANKLFMISKYHPVGIMIYGNATFMDINWETIIKYYRQKLGKRKFRTIKEYSVDFLKFLESEEKLFPESQQELFLRTSLYSYFYIIKEEFVDKIKRRLKEFDKKTEIESEELKEIVSSTIESHHEKLEKRQWISAVNGDRIDRKVLTNFKNKYKKIITEIKNVVFEKTPFSPSDHKKMDKIALHLFFKDILSSSNSGVVIAGFGDEEIFPALESYTLEGIVFNKLKFVQNRSTQIDFQHSACIAPFAQSEMVYSFMEGVDPIYEDFMIQELSEIFDNYANSIIEHLFPPPKEPHLTKKFKEINQKIVEKYLDGLKKFRREVFADPVINIVETLPKVELAEMAESLVNITKFKRKVSSEAETVGGPVDVAVISKDDGFIWIKRKHYFKPEFNPHFLYNYYREVQDEKRHGEDI